MRPGPLTLRRNPTALLGLLALLASAASAQDANLEPHFGTTTVALGFSPDPLGYPVLAGGGDTMLDVSLLRLVDSERGNACGTFYIDAAPTFRVELRADEHAPFRFLRLYTDVPAGSRTDPALLVQKPDGSWRCIDDSAYGSYEGLMPILDFESPPPGSYTVWVGSYLRNAAEPATLFISAYRTSLPASRGD
jgi:protease YdgD